MGIPNSEYILEAELTEIPGQEVTTSIKSRNNGTDDKDENIGRSVVLNGGYSCLLEMLKTS